MKELATNQQLKVGVVPQLFGFFKTQVKGKNQVNFGFMNC